MISSRLMNILRSPIATEKSDRCRTNERTMVFRVLKDANKYEIKKAVEVLFGWEVESVRTLNVLGKKRRSAHGYGSRSDWKKAYVTVTEGQSLDLDIKNEGKESN